MNENELVYLSCDIFIELVLCDNWEIRSCLNGCVRFIYSVKVKTNNENKEIQKSCHFIAWKHLWLEMNIRRKFKIAFFWIFCRR